MAGVFFFCIFCFCSWPVSEAAVRVDEDGRGGKFDLDRRQREQPWCPGTTY